MSVEILAVTGEVKEGKPSNKGWFDAVQKALTSIDGKLSFVSYNDVNPDMLKSATQPLGGVIIDTAYIPYGKWEEIVTEVIAAQPHTKVIVASAGPTWKSARDAFNAGASDYIAQSLDIEELTSQLHKSLSDKQ